jgi:hypothetical protein
MWLAKRTPKVRNYLGLEIRRKVGNNFLFVLNAVDDYSLLFQ